nr:uncharacterized protein LOC123752868 [Procambarus clarkii]
MAGRARSIAWARLVIISSLAVTWCLGRLPLPASLGKLPTLTLAGEALQAVLSEVTVDHCSVILLTDGTASSTHFFRVKDQLVAPWGMAVLEVSAEGQDTNLTLSLVVGQAQRVGHSHIAADACRSLLLADGGSSLSHCC